MSKFFSVFSVGTAFVAMVLLLLSTISTPTTFSTNTNLDIVRVSGLSPQTGDNVVNVTDTSPYDNINQNRVIDGLRVGTWGYCTSSITDSGYGFCRKTSHGWQARFNSTSADGDSAYSSTQIKSSWTRGLVVAVVAFVVAFIGMVLAIIPKLAAHLIAFIVLFVGFLLALIAFIIQIVLYIYVRNRMHQISGSASVMPGPSFYFTLISIPLLFLASITACCGHRREKNKNATPAYYTPTAVPALDSNGKGDAYGTTGTAGTGESIPMNSRQKVLNAFHGSREASQA